MFNTKAKPSVNLQKLVKRSENAFSIFTKTVDDLTQINNEIATEEEKTIAEIASLQTVSEELSKSRKRNLQVIQKVKEIIAVD